WRGVKVKLSTGYPNSSPQAADPQPWRITYRPHEEQTVTVTGIRAAPQSVVRRNHDSVVDAVFAEDVGKMPDKNVAESLQRITSTYTSEFEAPAPVNLPADGREISVKLSDDTVAVAQKIRVAPRLNTAAVVTAEAPRMEGAWVPGDIQLFRDGSYVGESHWNPQSSQGFVFSFGTDDLVRVKVVQGKDRSGTTGLLSKQAERTASATYSISSAHKTPVDLLVLESSPVSASDAITVETTFTPQPTQKEWSDKPGVMAWEKKLAPGETFKLNVDYSVTYPREGTTIGLP
ncbi:MAG: mucoidy inhibitor MuiA family protein, partial [Paucimonas sp.]|nr:mucoidy inhibitor MuiA family protein [Paucimonas sp.]